MAFLVDLFASRSLENPSTPLSAPDDWLGDALGSFKASSGVRVNRETALTYSPIYKGVSLIAGDVGKLPMHVDRIEARGRIRHVEHPAYALLRWKPNDAMTASQFKETLQGHAILDGNGYAYIWRDGAGRPIELSILAPRQVTPVRYNGVLWYVYQFLDGETRKLPYTDILHIKGFSFDGLVGYNLVHKARESIGWGMAMQTYGSVFFRNNATPRVVLEHPGRMRAEAATNLRTSWERLHAGLENAHRTAVLEEGMKAQILSISAKDAQLLEGMKFSLVDVANWLKLPPHKVGADITTAYASLEQENQAYLDDCLDLWLVKWEEECWDKLLTEREKRSMALEVRFDRKQLVRANLSERTVFYTAMMQWGAYSPNDVLMAEGENPQPGDLGDVYYRPLNMQMVKEGGDEEKAAAGGATAILDVPDVRQPNRYSCGAAASMCVGKFFEVGPDSIQEWEAALGTTLEKSTHPMRIVQYLSQLGLAVTAAQGMTIDDLRMFVSKGCPVICPVQDYGDQREPGAAFLYGHYLTVIGVIDNYVICQDSSEDDVIAPGADSIQADGKIIIDADTWMEAWHDQDADGNKYINFGIAVAQELDQPGPEDSDEDVAPSSDAEGDQGDQDEDGQADRPQNKDQDDTPTGRSKSKRCGGPGSGVPGPCGQPKDASPNADQKTKDAAQAYAEADNKTHGKAWHLLTRPDSPDFNDPNRVAAENSIDKQIEAAGKNFVKSYQTDADQKSGNTVYWMNGEKKLSVYNSKRGTDEGGVIVEREQGTTKIKLMPTDTPQEAEKKINKILGIKSANAAEVTATQRAGMLRALSQMLTDACRRMVKRVGLHAERAAADPKKYTAWLDSIAADHGDAVRDAFTPATRALEAMDLGGESPADWMLAEVTRAFSRLADTCTRAELPTAVSAAADLLVESLPATAVNRFIESKAAKRPEGKK